MDYNSNTYLTISHSDCEVLKLGGEHRINNTKTICILEYPSFESIPADISAVMIQTYTHEEALALVGGSEWVSDASI